MKVRVRLLLVVLVVGLLGGGAFLLGRNLLDRYRADLRDQVLDVLPQVAQRILDFKRVKVDDGKKVWEISAKEAQYYQDRDLIIVNEPAVSVHMENGQTVALQGKEGRVFLNGRDLQRVELNGSIQVQLGKYALQVDSADYDREQQKISAPGSVRISGEEFEVHGEGMTIEMPSQRLIVDKNVRMTLHAGT